MTRRAWLRHPPKTTPPPADCPRGRPYASRWLAAAVPAIHHSNTRLTPERCTTPECGWHLAPTTKESNR